MKYKNKKWKKIVINVFFSTFYFFTYKYINNLNLLMPLNFIINKGSRKIFFFLFLFIILILCHIEMY